MFCKKCGREIKADVTFCPGCGAAVKSSRSLAMAGNPSVGVSLSGNPSVGVSPSGPSSTDPLSAGALSPGMIPVAGGTAPAGKGGRFPAGAKYAVLLGIVLLIAAAVIAVAVTVLRHGEEELPEEEYTVAGTWTSDDMEDMGEILSDIVYESLLDSMDSSSARMIGDGVGEIMDGFSGSLEVVFREDGALELYVSDITLEAVSLSYEVIDGSEMKLTMQFPSFNLPIVGNVEIPSISYKSEYSVAKKWMTLDFFGHELEFTRKK